MDENLYNKIMNYLKCIAKSPGDLSKSEKTKLEKLYSMLCKADGISEKSGWRVSWQVKKYKNQDSNSPYAVINAGQNIILNSGANEIMKLICGQSHDSFGPGNSRIVVGNNSTAENASQTGVLGKSSSAHMSRGFPIVSNGTAMFEAAFGAGQANFEWNEISITNGKTAMNRKVLTGFGTKPSSEVWVVRASVEIVYVEEV